MQGHLRTRKCNFTDTFFLTALFLSSGYQRAPEEWNEYELFLFELRSVKPVSKLARQLSELRSWSTDGPLNC